jgi:hypothetical protein
MLQQRHNHEYVRTTQSQDTLLLMLLFIYLFFSGRVKTMFGLLYIPRTKLATSVVIAHRMP